MQVINRIQRLRKHAGLVATEPVEVWLHERRPAAPPRDPRVPATSAAASNGSAAAPPASAGAGAQIGNGEVFDADGPAADRRAAAVSLCSLLESQVATWGILGIGLAYQASLVVYHNSRQSTQERKSRDWLKHHVNFSSCGWLSMRFEAHL